MLWRKSDNIAGQSRAQFDRHPTTVALLTVALCGSMFLVVSRLKASYSSPIVLATTDKPDNNIGNVTHQLESSALNSNGNLTGNPNSASWARAALVGADSTFTLIVIYIDVLYGIACGTIAFVRLGLSSRPIDPPRLFVFISMTAVIAFANYLAFRLTAYVLA